MLVNPSSKTTFRTELESQAKAKVGTWPLYAMLALAVLTLAVGGLAGWLWRSADQDYSALINEGIPLLNDLQTITRRNADIYALIFELVPAQDPVSRAQLIPRMKQAMQDDDAIMAEAARMTQTDTLQDSYARLSQQRQRFIAALKSFSHLEYSGGTTAERLMNFNRQTLAPAFLAYQKQLDTFCDDCQAYYLQRNSLLVERSTQHRRLLWMLSSVPLVVLGLAVLLMLGLMIRLLVRFLFDHPAT